MSDRLSFYKSFTLLCWLSHFLVASLLFVMKFPWSPSTVWVINMLKLSHELSCFLVIANVPTKPPHLLNTAHRSLLSWCGSSEGQCFAVIPRATNSFSQAVVNESCWCSSSDSEIIPLHYTIHWYLMFNLCTIFFNEKSWLKKQKKIPP